MKDWMHLHASRLCQHALPWALIVFTIQSIATEEDQTAAPAASIVFLDLHCMALTACPKPLPVRLLIQDLGTALNQ